MKKTLFNLILFAICAMYGVSAHAQRVALKTNAIDWLMLSPNLSLETRLSAHMTLDVGFSANPFPFRSPDTDGTICDFSRSCAITSPDLCRGILSVLLHWEQATD